MRETIKPVPKIARRVNMGNAINYQLQTITSKIIKKKKIFSS